MGLTLLNRRDPLSSTERQRGLLADTRACTPFEERLRDTGLAPLLATGITVLQVNVGKLCNQTCRHCHVDAGPDRQERMSLETAEACIRLLTYTDIPTLDITGGAPELSPHFRRLVEQGTTLGRHVIDRCNLSVLLLPSQADLVGFLARHNVEVIASLPYFRRSQTDAQRGEGVYAKSIEALRLLNQAGYGQEGSGLTLNLVHNPVGAFLPPRQASIESQFRRELLRHHGIRFNHLYTIANMPISRYLEFLLESGNFDGYMERLATAFNPSAAAGVMCRYTLSVGWDGSLYDCDFNQMLELPLASGNVRNVREVTPDQLTDLNTRPIVLGNHCYGCTAGTGSSCGGAVTS